MSKFDKERMRKDNCRSNSLNDTDIKQNNRKFNWHQDIHAKKNFFWFFCLFVCFVFAFLGPTHGTCKFSG